MCFKQNSTLKFNCIKYDNRNKWIENFKKQLQASKCKSKCDDRKYTQTKSGITVSAGVSTKIQKNIMYAKKIIFGILLNVVAKMVNI